MENSNIKQTAVNVVRNIFGATHFILQSSSDIVLESEGIFVEKTLGTDRDTVIKQRTTVTNERISKASTRLNNVNKK